MMIEYYVKEPTTRMKPRRDGSLGESSHKLSQVIITTNRPSISPCRILRRKEDEAIRIVPIKCEFLETLPKLEMPAAASSPSKSFPGATRGFLNNKDGFAEKKKQKKAAAMATATATVTAAATSSFDIVMIDSIIAAAAAGREAAAAAAAKKTATGRIAAAAAKKQKEERS